MLHLNLFVFEEPNQERSDYLHTDRGSRPLDLLTKILVIIAFEIHIEGVLAFSNNEHLSELVEDRHCYSCEVYASSLVLCLFLRRLLVSLLAAIKHRKSLDSLALPEIESRDLLTISFV